MCVCVCVCVRERERERENEELRLSFVASIVPFLRSVTLMDRIRYENDELKRRIILLITSIRSFKNIKNMTENLEKNIRRKYNLKHRKEVNTS